MGSVTTRVTQNASLAFVEHHPDKNDTWQLIFSSRTTGDGGADGSTIVDGTRDSGAANTYNGRYWVRIKSGANNGAWKRVILDETGNGTLKVEGGQDSDGFAAQVVSGVDYELWLSPEPVIVVDSSSGSTDVVDAVRDEPDDFWEGYYLVCISGARRGQKAEVTGFTSATGTFVVGTGFSGALTAGDVCLLRRYIDPISINDGTAHAFNPRPMNRLDGSKGDGSIGTKGGTFGFDVAALGVYRSGSRSERAILGGLLVACGFEEVFSGVDTGDAVSAQNSTTALDIATGGWENYELGCLLSAGGELAYITALTDGGGSDDTITVSPALGSAPDTAAQLPRSVNYQRSRRADDGEYGAVTIVKEVDGIRTTMTGCRGNLTISGENELMFGFEFQVDHYVREHAPCQVYIGDAYPTYEPIMASERRCYFGSTAVELGAISVTLNNEVSPKTVQGASGINGRAGFGHSSVNPGVTCRKLMSTTAGEEVDADERWFARTSHDVMLFWGNTMYGGCAVRMPVARLVAEPKPEDDNGAQVTPFVFEAMTAGTATDPDSAVTKLPDFSISFA